MAWTAVQPKQGHADYWQSLHTWSFASKIDDYKWEVEGNVQSFVTNFEGNLKMCNISLKSLFDVEAKFVSACHEDISIFRRLSAKKEGELLSSHSKLSVAGRAWLLLNVYGGL